MVKQKLTTKQKADLFDKLVKQGKSLVKGELCVLPFLLMNKDDEVREAQSHAKYFLKVVEKERKKILNKEKN